MRDIFEIIENNDELVIIKVNADDPLTVARHPYVSSEYAYITITKGSTHIFTVTKKDGTTWSFYWGVTGHTLIGQSTEVLKKKCLQLLKDNNIDIERRK